MAGTTSAISLCLVPSMSPHWSWCAEFLFLIMMLLPILTPMAYSDISDAPPLRGRCSGPCRLVSQWRKKISDAESSFTLCNLLYFHRSTTPEMRWSNNMQSKQIRLSGISAQYQYPVPMVQLCLENGFGCWLELESKLSCCLNGFLYPKTASTDKLA